MAVAAAVVGARLVCESLAKYRETMCFPVVVVDRIMMTLPCLGERPPPRPPSPEEGTG